MKPGEVVGERFEIQRLAGSGGVGAVYRAMDRTTGTAVALKVLLGSPRAEDTRRFEREARALDGLDHPGIVRYVAHGLTRDGKPYLAMAWIEGESLEARLSRGPLTVDETLTLGARLCDALGAAHASGVVHRDLKPGNVVLAGGVLAEAKIIDFGLAVRPNTARPTLTGVVVGTPAYMAPEQAMGVRELDARADVFALGCILYECIAGRPAFEGMHVMAVLAKIVLEEVPSLRDLGRDVPPVLDTLVARMLSKDPAARPTDAAAVATALCPLEATLAGGFEPPSIPPPESRGLTAAEQRLLCVVLAKAPPGPPLDPVDDTLSASSVSQAVPAVLSTLEARGAVAAVLVDGTVVVASRGSGVASDQAAAAAGFALVLREGLPGWTISVATGRAEVQGERPVGHAIELAAARVRARQSGPQTVSIDLDEVTAGLLDLRFEVKAGPLGLELAGERDVAEKARTLLGRPTAMVGRDRELESLDEIFEECVSEPMAHAVLVTAPAGTGKSRLRHELLERIRARGGAEIWLARGDPARAGASAGLVAQMIRGAARLYDGEAAPGRMQKLLARVSRHVPAAERRRVAEFLGELTGTAFPDEGRVELHAARHDLRLLGDQMRRAWIDLVDAETRAGPLVLVLEDMHWGDAPSADYVDAVLRLFVDRPLMVLALARPEVHDRLPKLWHGRVSLEVRLAALPKRACEQLARDVLGEGARPAIVKDLCERSAGNAFFLEELLRATAEGRGGALPETVRAMVESRLDALDPEDRRLLRAASVLGGVFWRGGLRALLGGLGGGESLAERLKRLEEREWIVRRATPKFEGEEEYAFRHATVREVAYGMLTEDDRALGHRLAGAWLEEAGETDALMLAEHLEAGGEAARAVRWYTVAAEQALEGNDLAGVVARVDRAVALGAGGDDLGRLALAGAIAHNWRGERAEAGRWAARAGEVLPEGSARWCAALGEMIWTAGARGDGEGIVGLCERLLAAPAVGDALGAQTVALSHAMAWLVQTGHYEDARAIEATIDLVMDRLRSEPAVAGAVLAARAMLAVLTDDSSRQRQLYAEALTYLEGVGDLRAACLHRSNLADTYNRVGAYREAEGFARKTMAAADRMGLPYAFIAAQHNLGFALARRGALAEAREVLSAAIETAVAQGEHRIEGGARVYLAATLKLAGDLAGAEREARQAIEVFPATTPTLSYARAVLADVLLAAGRVAEAIEEATSAHAQLEALGQVEEGEAVIRLAYAEALHARGDLAAARAAIATAQGRVLARATRVGDEPFRRSFLENIPEHARTLALAAEWLSAPAGG